MRNSVLITHGSERVNNIRVRIKLPQVADFEVFAFFLKTY